ncbi:hypothetical protein LY28_03686 [Ruminiclostridium sufflavum DSM 19573]|uniref:Uncharacterized protein n=1 Tax=Ruminiclostridium sufflavum DSM 19573 TaxID=1121337 RepID=A0A318XHE9_9FIRM|nr:hypothetical protein [Ruminiclostridium sufflavum]PYG84291.1 hypothetical protein LY28_03686 [Ruminiclostridium sufflavum DSM 19573]
MGMIHYLSESDFKKSLDKYCLDKCSKCGGILEVSMEHITVNVVGKTMDIEEIPMLKCKKCGVTYYSYYAQEILYGMYNELKRRGDLGVKSKPNGYRKMYDYAASKGFVYDHRDYESIPGLRFDDEHSKEGFLTPVFFDRKALLYFIADPEYIVDIFSETYGHIGKKDSEGIYPYEWDVPFGFNTNGKLVFWLGDIDTMDDMSQGIFRNFNIASDHLLIDSEFYQAQMNCIFSEPIKEKQIISNMKIFVNNIHNKYGIELSHLVNECKIQEINIKRPIVFNEQSVSGIVNAFDKILVEGISVVGLKSLYETLYGEKRKLGYEKWQSIRLIKEILKQLGSGVQEMPDIEKMISPLYILHDYRIYLDHLLSENEQEKTRLHISETMGAEKFSEQEKIYYELIRRLDVLYQYLVLLSK